MIFTPWLRVLRTPYPDLAGLLMRNWEREGFLVRYRHDRCRGFVIVAVRPHWCWAPGCIFRHWLAWPTWALLVRLHVGVLYGWLLLWLLFGAGR